MSPRYQNYQVKVEKAIPLQLEVIVPPPTPKSLENNVSQLMARVRAHPEFPKKLDSLSFDINFANGIQLVNKAFVAASKLVIAANLIVILASPILGIKSNDHYLFLAATTFAASMSFMVTSFIKKDFDNEMKPFRKEYANMNRVVDGIVKEIVAEKSIGI